MKLVTKFLLAAALLVATPALAEDIVVSFGSDECSMDTSNCIIFLGSMTDDELRAAGFSLAQLAAANRLVDFDGLDAAPAYTWFSTS